MPDGLNFTALLCSSDVVPSRFTITSASTRLERQLCGLEDTRRLLRACVGLLRTTCINHYVL